MKLSNRLFLSMSWIIAISILGSAVAGAVLISRAVRSEAFERVNSDLRVARLYLNQWMQDLSVLSQARAEGVEARFPMLRRPDLSVMIGERTNQDLYRYIAASSGTQPERASSGFILLPYELVREMGIQREVSPEELCDRHMTLWLYAVAQGSTGAVFTGIMLNGNYGLVSELQDLLFGQQLYEGKPFGTVTVFCSDKRVATTVLGPEGRIAVGTRVSDVVRGKVLEQGGVWLDRALVVDDWYLSAYEPIEDGEGGNIGILYVGVLEQYYLNIRNRTLLFLSSILIPALFLFVFSVYLVSRSIVRPVGELARASGRIARGELATRVGVESNSSELRTLAASFNQMADSINRREDLLREKNLQLESANRDYQELLSFVTHELNNSVGSLLLNVSLLNDESTGELEPEKSEIALQIQRDVERFRDMVRNYLNISRLEKGTLRFHPASLRMRESVVEPVLKRLKLRIEHKGMEVHWDWSCDLPVRADHDLMDICYSNLLVNALKYGRDWIELSCRKEMDAEGGRTGSGVGGGGGNTASGALVFGVRNGGPPIPEDKIELLFQKFSRLVKSDDGAGLGLYLIRQIVERHGGTVWCESSAEKGTGFYMKLPVSTLS